MKTSGLIFDQKSGMAFTDERVEFAVAQGTGSSVGAVFDSGNGQLVLDHAVEVVCDESFPTRDEALETIIDRLEDCVDLDELRTERVQ